MTIQDLATSPEAELGKELHFCPIRGLPIQRSQRVRTNPGFHLLSLDAGKEALARGFYDAFGARFNCVSLEYLHPDDKVFLCAEDHKAFLNQMSMQYHRYIRHELEERKAERKRLRERAEERKLRASQMHARAAAGAPEPHAPMTPMTPAPSRLAPPVAAPQEEDYSLLAKDDPYSQAVAAAPSAPAAPTKQAGAAVAAAQPLPLAAEFHDIPASTVQPQPASKAAAQPDSEDLYGDVDGREAKKARGDSTYASAMTAMLGNDFDEDE